MELQHVIKCGERNFCIQLNNFKIYSSDSSFKMESLGTDAFEYITRRFPRVADMNLRTIAKKLSQISAS